MGLRTIFRNRGVERILDASCGAGAQTIPLAQLNYKVVAVDPSAGMLRKAQEFATRYGVADKIQFERGDFFSLPTLVQAPFDAVITRGNALPHLILDEEIEHALRNFYDLLRPGGTLVIGMRDFAPFMEDRPRFIPGFVHQFDNGDEFVSFDIWEWHDGSPVIATQNLYIVTGCAGKYETIKRHVMYRPLSTDEVKVVLLETGFEEVSDQPNRWERVLVARKPLGG